MKSLYSLILGVFCLGLLSGLPGCYSDSEEALYPEVPPAGTPDTTAPSYADDIVPILQRNCYGCHGEATHSVAGAGINLEGYDNLKVYVDNGRFWGSINHDSGFSPMPKGGARLPALQLDLIQRWIDDGAPDN